jgi:hypothetical protein
MMLLVESIKRYAGRLKTDKALLSYLDTEDLVARYDPDVTVDSVTDEWLSRFKGYAGEKHARNVRKVLNQRM